MISKFEAQARLQAPPANELRVRRSLLPRQLSDAEFSVFAEVGQRREARRGETIFRRGELGRSMFVVESGEVQLEFGGGMPDKLIGPREFFGELALFIGNHARVANAVAYSPCVLQVVEHAIFETLLASDPALLAQFMRRSFSYLVANEQQLIANLKRRNEDLLVTLDSLRRTESALDTAQRLVQTDELTGLCNRRGLYKFLERFEEHRVPGMQMALLLVDLDNFKRINDRCGHLLGDQALLAVAQEVQNAALPCDLPCRLGGDEFALITQVADPDELNERARQVAAGVRSLRLTGCETITVSIGGTLCDRDGWASWYTHADVALYDAKAAGGDDWRVLVP